MYQVCFDEHPEETSNGCYDPFYVAGFMHLFCLEEMIPMAELMSFADVRPDTRDFPLEQRNPMSLDRDGIGRTLLGAYQDWKKIHYDRFVDNNRPLPSAPRKSGDCLYKHLTVKKMEFQPTTRQKMRDQRNGFDISKHYGNLRKLMSHKADKRRRRKSKAPNEDNSEDVESDNEVAAAICAPPRKRQRSELPPVPATPLRRSYRLLNAAAALGDEAPTSQIPTFPDHVAAPVAAPLSVTVDNTYDAYGFPNYAFATIPDVAPMTHAHTAPRNLNVVTAQAGTMARHNVLGSLDLANVSLDMAPEAFRNFYEQIQLQSYATEPQTGLSPLPVYGASPQSPYPLRDTQARRESAVRLLSARTSLLNTGTFAIDPQLLQGPYNGGPAEPASPYNHVSNTEDGLKTPTRRVTRSMSRTVAAPFEVAAEASRSTILESTMGVPAEPTPGEITRLLDLDGSGDLFNEPSNDDGASFDIDLYLENYASANLHSPTPLEDSQVTTHEDNEG
ncbi:hypothetical protein SEPCBS119000_003009 [Sporothrix epigloea]|uniref:Uncharacterized protein n=1 Tax=Sporothrix epigloea TaxID=1892477 RepID=A0ABP0DJA8_9PEZI